MNSLSVMRTRTPNCSAFPFQVTDKMSNRIGDLRPVRWFELGPNDRLKLSASQLSRMLPMSAPAMANFRIDLDAVFVPSRIISKKYEKFFNAGTLDADRPNFPSVSYLEYLTLLYEIAGLFTPGLLDYLGFPTLENVKKFVRNIASCLHNGSTQDVNFLDFGAVFEDYDEVKMAASPLTSWLVDKDGFVVDTSASNIPPAASFYRLDVAGTSFYNVLIWLYNYDLTFNRERRTFPMNSSNLPSQSNFNLWLRSFGLDYEDTEGQSYSIPDILEKYCSFHRTHVVDLQLLYLDYIAYVLRSVVMCNHNGNSETIQSFYWFSVVCDTDNAVADNRYLAAHSFSLLPLFSFWKSYFDWYVNSVLENGQELTDQWSDFVTAFINAGASPFDYSAFSELDCPKLDEFFGITEYNNLEIFACLLNIPSRLWSVDRFTGAYTDLQNGPAVMIPSEGTIMDLRADNKLQTYLQKSLFGGTRTIDKNEIIFGARSSNQLLDRTEVLCRKSFDLDIQQVTNTAASDSFDLGTLAGQGFGISGDFLFDYTAEERGIVIIMASVVLPPSYVQAVDRNLMHTDYYDFLLPDFDSIGEQEINAEELYFDKGMILDNTMYNRRYYESIDFLSSVKGDLKNTLLHWHDARYFKDAPSLSPEFIRILPDNDDLERLFATYTHEQILHFFAFKGVVVRPMSKYVQFGL